MCLSPPVDRTARKSLIGFLLFWARGLKIHGTFSVPEVGRNQNGCTWEWLLPFLNGSNHVKSIKEDKVCEKSIVFSELYHLLTYTDYAV